MSFTYKVFQVVATIPKGEFLTYKEVAELAGSSEAYRAVGNIIHKNPNKQKYPCHRIIRSDRSLSKGYTFGGKEAQKKLLESEGFKFNNYHILK